MSAMSEKRYTRVFVYGTLMSGERNHGLLGKCALVGEGRTAPYYELVSLENYPGMVRGGRTSVLGEVYDVDSATLWLMDQLEGHPHYYQRGLVSTDWGELVQAYLLPALEVEGLPRIHDGDWRRASRETLQRLSSPEACRE